MNDAIRPSGGSARDPFRAALERQERLGLLREPVELDGAPGRYVVRAGLQGPVRCLNLASNNSLDLAGHPRIVARAREALERQGTGSGGSRLLGGDLPLHHELERVLEAWRPEVPGGRALVFGTGFQANLTVVSALAEATGGVFADKLVHASVAEGLRLHAAGGGRFHRFRHNDVGHLEALLQARQPADGGLVAVEALYSMDGDHAPFEALCDLQRRHGFWLLVDEAHSAGAYPGLHARAFGGLPERTILLGTFGKALGGFGAYVVAPRAVRDYLVNFGRGFVFSTSPPPAVLGAALGALEVLVQPEEAWRPSRLAEVSTRVREGLRARGFDTGAAAGHIVPVLLGTPERALAVSRALLQAGYHVPAIRPPTVPAGTARLRLSLTAAFTDAEADALVEAVAAAVARADGRPA